MSLLRTKSVEQSIGDAESSEFALKKNLSALDLTVFGIGVIIGAGIFTVTGRAAHDSAGPAIVLSFLIGAICCGLAAMCYAELSSTVPASGSAYTFSYATMGELIAWIVGWDLLLELVLAAGVVAQGWSAYFTILVDGWFTLPAKLQGGTGWFDHFDLPAFGLVAVLTCLIAIGIKESLRVNMALVTLKLFVVLFVIVMGVQYIDTSNYSPFIPPATHLEGTSETLKRPLWELLTGMDPQAYGVMGVISAASLVFFAYIGFDVVATTAEETRNPKRDLPIGILGSLVICTILYVAVCLVITGMVKYDKIDPSGALAAAFRDAGHPGFARIISAGAVAGLATVVMTLMIGATRVMYAMARDGLLPRTIARTSPKTGTPVKMTLGVGFFVAFAAALIPVGEFEAMVNIGTLSAFFLVSLAVPVLRAKRPDLERPFKISGSPVIPILSALVCLYLMLNLPVETWVRFLVWLALGCVIFFGWGKWESRVGLDDDGFRSAGVDNIHDKDDDTALEKTLLPAAVLAVCCVIGLAIVVFTSSSWWFVVTGIIMIAPGLVLAHNLTGEARRNGIHTTRYLRPFWIVLGVAFLVLCVLLYLDVA